MFSSTQFVPQIGIFNGIRPHEFTMSLNQRFTGNKWLALLEALLLKKVRSTGVFLRMALERTKSYEDFVDMVASTKFLAPSYVIVGGTERNQGVLLTMGQLGPDDIMFLDQSKDG